MNTSGSAVVASIGVTLHFVRVIEHKRIIMPKDFPAPRKLQRPATKQCYKDTMVNGPRLK